MGYNIPMKELLNIVDENDEITGQRTREEIHQEGLLHREIHVYYIPHDTKIIFQHRAKDKDTYPDLLDATVGGHVEIGQSYEEAAIRETEEETGVKVNPQDLIFIKKIRRSSHDKVTGKINSGFKAEYLYVYRGDIKDLKIEAGKALGFEAWLIDELASLKDKDEAKFILGILHFVINEVADFIKTIELQ